MPNKDTYKMTVEQIAKVAQSAGAKAAPRDSIEAIVLSTVEEANKSSKLRDFRRQLADKLDPDS